MKTQNCAVLVTTRLKVCPRSIELTEEGTNLIHNTNKESQNMKTNNQSITNINNAASTATKWIATIAARLTRSGATIA